MFSQSSNSSNKPSDRFARVINELNKSADQKGHSSALKPSSEISLFGRSSIDSSQRSTKYTHGPTYTTHSPHQSSTFQRLELDEEGAIEILLENFEVIANRKRTNITTEFILTSKGLRFVLRPHEGAYINLSWVHSAQELQKNKILLLYYSMQKIKANEKPTIDSLVIEFAQGKQLSAFLSAVLFIHERHHDQDVEKVYHQLCSGTTEAS